MLPCRSVETIYRMRRRPGRPGRKRACIIPIFCFHLLMLVSIESRFTGLIPGEATNLQTPPTELWARATYPALYESPVTRSESRRRHRGRCTIRRL